MLDVQVMFSYPGINAPKLNQPGIFYYASIFIPNREIK